MDTNREELQIKVVFSSLWQGLLIILIIIVIIIIIMIIIVVVIIIIIIELTHSKTIQEITVEIELQPAALDFKNFSQYSSRSK